MASDQVKSITTEEVALERDDTASGSITSVDTKCRSLGFSASWLQLPKLRTNNLVHEVNRRPLYKWSADECNDQHRIGQLIL